MIVVVYHVYLSTPVWTQPCTPTHEALLVHCDLGVHVRWHTQCEVGQKIPGTIELVRFGGPTHSQHDTTDSINFTLYKVVSKNSETQHD